MADTAQTPVIYVAIDGETASIDLTRRILSLTVDEHAKKATKITLTLDDSDGAIASGNLMREGQTIGVRFGYVGSLSRARGAIVHKVQPGYADGNATVEAYGKELALSAGPIRRAFQGQSFRGALENVCRDAGITPQWEAGATGGVRLDGDVIDNETAWSWVLRQSTALALDVEFVGNTLTVRPPRSGDQPVTVLHYKWRNAEILSFETETNAKNRQHENEGVVALFIDPATGERLTHAAGDPNTTRATLASRRVEAQARTNAGTRAAEEIGQANYERAHPEIASQTPAQRRAAYTRERDRARRAGETPTEDNPALMFNLNLDDPEAVDRAVNALTAGARGGGGSGAAQPATAPTVVAADRTAAREHVRQRAEGRVRERERQRVKAKVTCIGLPSLTKGQIVQVVGVSPRDAGLWIVKGCTHKIGDGYETELELRRDGVNGRHGTRPGAAARPNQHRGATTPGMQETLVPVNVGGIERRGGRERG